LRSASGRIRAAPGAPCRRGSDGVRCFLPCLVVAVRLTIGRCPVWILRAGYLVLEFSLGEPQIQGAGSGRPTVRVLVQPALMGSLSSARRQCVEPTPRQSLSSVSFEIDRYVQVRSGGPVVLCAVCKWPAAVDVGAHSTKLCPCLTGSSRCRVHPCRNGRSNGKTARHS
jgi:hypothetical protein